MADTANASALSQAAPPGGSNAAGSPQSPLAALADMVALADSPVAIVPEESPKPDAQPGPETQPDTAAVAAPDTNLSPEQSPPAGENPAGDSTESPTEEAGSREQGAGSPETPTPPAEPKIPKGAQARIDELTGKNYQLKGQLEELQQQHAELKQKLESAATPPPALPDMPEAVAKLTTVSAVKQRESFLKTARRTINFELTAHPQGNTEPDPQTSEPRWKLGNQVFNREQMAGALADGQSELDALPDRREQIELGERSNAMRSQARTAFATDAPWVNDAESPQMKAVSERLQKNPWIKQAFAVPEYAAHVWNLGEKAYQAELAARKGPAKPAQAAKIIQPRVPLTPKGVGAASSASPVGNGNGEAGSRGARPSEPQRNGNGYSVESLAVTLSETGR